MIPVQASLLAQLFQQSFTYLYYMNHSQGLSLIIHEFIKCCEHNVYVDAGQSFWTPYKGPFEELQSIFSYVTHCFTW